jgi:hypothetical protein
MAFSDLVLHEGGGEISRRRYLKLCALAKAAELFSREVSGFFGNQRGDNEELLEGLEDSWMNKG